MSKSLMSKVANALSFAHLAGLPTARASSPADETKDDGDKTDDEKAEDEDPKKKREDETADEYAKRMEKDDEDDAKASTSASAPVDVAAIKAEAYAAGVTAERARGAAIFASTHAAGNIPLAAELAFQTDLSSERVVALLKRAPAASADPHRADRADRNPKVGTFGGAAQNPAQAIATGWDAAFAKANPGVKR